MPVVNEGVVNTTTQGEQYRPAIAPLDDGGWIVLWHETSRTGFGGAFVDELRLQRFDATGAVVGPESPVIGSASIMTMEGGITGLAEGGWVVTWTFTAPSSLAREIWQQRYDAAGQPAGAGAPVPIDAANDASDPIVTALSDGGWVVLWSAMTADGMGRSLYQQRFDAEGDRVGGEAPVDFIGAQPGASAVAALPDGGWLVVTSVLRSADAIQQIVARRFDAEGQAVGAEMPVSTFEGEFNGRTAPAVVALADGGWLVTWQSFGQDHSFGEGIFQQRFAANGTRVGVETQVNSTLVHLSQTNPFVVAHEDGGWLVLWQTFEPQTGSDVYGRRFLANGQPFGEDFRINDYVPGSQAHVAAAVLEGSDLIITWASGAPSTPDGFAGSGHDGAGSGIVQSRFTVSPVQAGTEGADSLTASARGDIALGYGGDDTLVGGAGEDLFHGGAGRDSMSGGAANDTLEGGADNDRLWGDAGNDSLLGEGGNDTAQGGAGNDTVEGGEGNDSLSGDGENDLLSGGNGNDTLSGGEGDDRVWGNAGNDLVWGEAGNDQVAGGDGDDQVAGGDGNDTVWGSNGSDTAWGGNGHDTLYGGGSNDTVYGGSHNDLIHGDEGNDSLFGDGSSDTIHGGAGDDVIDGGSSADTVHGDAGADSLLGGSNNDLLQGGTEKDTVRGGTGNDTVYGGSHDDRIWGESGNDILYGDGSSDTIYGGDGNDLVDGGSSADRLYGGSNSDTLIGGSNNDTLYGGASSDRLTGGTGRDVFVFSTAIGVSVDVITDFTVVDDTIWLEDHVFAGLSPGALAAAAFVANTSGLATTAAHRVIYESDTGALWFDADGSGAGARVQFATLGTGLALTAADFLVI